MGKAYILKIDSFAINFVLVLTFCPLALEKTLTQIFRSVPSSGVFLKHHSKHIKSVSTGDQISMPNEMSRTTTMMHARFTSTQRCISSGAGLNLVLDQVL